jgi:hypothetical protein
MKINKGQKEFLAIVSIAVLSKLIIHFFANGNYGFHRDELLHLAVSEHLDWGFMEFPPLVAVFGKIATTFFGDSLFAVRALPTLAGVLILILTAKTVKELSGNLISLILACLSFLGVFAFWRNHTLFQPVVFDQFFWTLGSFWLVRFVKTTHYKYLIFIGITAGLGLLNKYTMLFWGVGLAISLLFHEKGSVYKQKWIWLAGAISLLIFLPNLIWQSQHNWPVIGHLTGLYEVQLEESSRLDFLTSQFFGINPFNFPIWLGGLLALFLSKDLKKYKPLGVLFIVSGLVLFLAKGRGYYFYAAYPVLLASGSVWIGNQFEKKKLAWLVPIYGAIILVTCLLYLPNLTPILPIEKYVEYAEIQTNEEGRLEGLTNDYADMFGWEEQVALVDSVYRTLSETEKSNCIIWAENYGEAGAISHLGKKYNLPKAACKHGSFWLWGAESNDGEIAISIGNEDDAVDYFFEEKVLIKTIKHKYAIDEEHNIPLYLCRKPRIKLKDYWPQYESVIFE